MHPLQGNISQNPAFVISYANASEIKKTTAGRLDSSTYAFTFAKATVNKKASVDRHDYGITMMLSRHHSHQSITEITVQTASGRFGVGSPEYRYTYQGQERDGKTGFEAFELRSWDARIGRWKSPDLYGQYHSTYLGMGNNPVAFIDPDGGFCVCQLGSAGLGMLSSLTAGTLSSMSNMMNTSPDLSLTAGPGGYVGDFPYREGGGSVSKESWVPIFGIDLSFIDVRNGSSDLMISYSFHIDLGTNFMFSSSRSFLQTDLSTYVGVESGGINFSLGLVKGGLKTMATQASFDNNLLGGYFFGGSGKLSLYNDGKKGGIFNLGIHGLIFGNTRAEFGYGNFRTKTFTNPGWSGQIFGRKKSPYSIY